MKMMAALIAAALLLPAAARASGDCPAAARSALTRPRVRLVSCDEAQGYLLALQDYLGEDQEYAGLTLSVFDASSFPASPRPLAVETGLGDRALEFRIEGRLVKHWPLDPGRDGRPGILFRSFNPPHTGLFVSFRFDPAARKLELQSADVAGDAGSVPEIRSDGALSLSGKAYDAQGVEVPYERTYLYRDGAFVPRTP